MSDLVTRLARLHDDCKDWSEYGEYDMVAIAEAIVEIGRLTAVIVALREPTEAMSLAGYEAANEEYNNGGAPGYSDEIWRAMYAEATK